MIRISSPGWYWRTSENAMPRPLKTEWYWPASRSETILRVLISSLRMRLMSSFGNKGRSGNFDAIEDALDDLLRRQLLCLRFIGEGNPVTQDIEADRLDILWRDESTVSQEGVGFGRQVQIDGRARAGAVLDEVLQILKPGVGRLAGGENDVQDVVLHLLVDVDLMDY